MLCVHPIDTELSAITAIAVYILVRLNVLSIVLFFANQKRNKYHKCTTSAMTFLFRSFLACLKRQRSLFTERKINT